MTVVGVPFATGALRDGQVTLDLTELVERWRTTGKRNGIVRAWVDGVLVFEKTDIRFRLNEGIKINEVWLNWYHGGRKPAAATHHWRMSNVVVARSYIGPMSKVVQRQRRRPGAEGE